MEVLLFDRAYYQRHYNCSPSFFNESAVPVAERRHNTAIQILYTVLQLLYVAVVWAMSSAEFRRRPSYKLMLQLGVVHIVGLQASGGVTGVLAIEGAVFCSHPTFIYVVGLIGLTTWCGSTFTNMLLGINRCSELYGGGLAERLFGGRRVYAWMAAPVAYMLYVLAFSPPPLYSGIQMAWFFNPFYGYFDDFGAHYTNPLHSWNNLFVCCTELAIYTTLIALYFRATALASPEIRNSLRKEKRLYVQIVLIGVVHFVASTCYVGFLAIDESYRFLQVLMQFVPVNFWTTLTASTFYLLSQGLPSCIYLGVNRSIRRALAEKCGFRKVRPAAGSLAFTRTPHSQPRDKSSA
ncbi:hypothetical protein M3Y99_00111100 [Aphelenchoides fujianensis]|nr:hypothetical protein M3Y99_00111100 [Aphelenchoides fujianensis]